MDVITFNNMNPWFASMEEVNDSTVDHIIFDTVADRIEISALPMRAMSITLINSPNIHFTCDCHSVTRVSCNGVFFFNDAKFANLQNVDVFSEFDRTLTVVEKGMIFVNNKNVHVLFSYCDMKPKSLDAVVANNITFESCHSRLIPALAHGVSRIQVTDVFDAIAFTNLPDSLTKITLSDNRYSADIDAMVREHNHKKDYLGEDRLTVSLYNEETDREIVVVFDNVAQSRDNLVEVALERMPKHLANYVQQFLRGQYLEKAPYRTQKKGAGRKFRKKKISKTRTRQKKRQSKTRTRTTQK